MHDLLETFGDSYLILCFTHKLEDGKFIVFRRSKASLPRVWECYSCSNSRVAVDLIAQLGSVRVRVCKSCFWGQVTFSK